jgi:hypothetical protein
MTPGRRGGSGRRAVCQSQRGTGQRCRHPQHKFPRAGPVSGSVGVAHDGLGNSDARIHSLENKQAPGWATIDDFKYAVNSVDGLLGLVGAKGLFAVAKKAEHGVKDAGANLAAL